MKILRLDASAWKTADDAYNAVLMVLGAPSWHGRNLSALNDSIAGGEINSVEVPYQFVIQNYNHMGSEAKSMIDEFIRLIRDLAAGGTPVDIRLENACPEPLADILHRYMNVNAHTMDEYDRLRKELSAPQQADNAILFRQQLKEAILYHTLTPEDYERLTGEDLDTAEELEKRLREFWESIYNAPFDPGSSSQA